MMCGKMDSTSRANSTCESEQKERCSHTDINDSFKKSQDHLPDHTTRTYCQCVWWGGGGGAWLEICPVCVICSRLKPEILKHLKFGRSVLQTIQVRGMLAFDSYLHSQSLQHGLFLNAFDVVNSQTDLERRGTTKKISKRFQIELATFLVFTCRMSRLYANAHFHSHNTTQRGPSSLVI